MLSDKTETKKCEQNDGSEFTSQNYTQNSLNDSGIVNIMTDNSFYMDSQIMSQPMLILNSNGVYSQKMMMDECFDVYGNFIDENKPIFYDDMNIHLY